MAGFVRTLNPLMTGSAEYSFLSLTGSIPRLTGKHFKRNTSLADRPVDIIISLTFGVYCLLISLVEKEVVDIRA